MEYKTRTYKCTVCGNEIKTATNHEGEIYPACTGACHQIIGGSNKGNNPANGGFRTSVQTPHKFIKE